MSHSQLTCCLGDSLLPSAPMGEVEMPGWLPVLEELAGGHRGDGAAEWRDHREKGQSFHQASD